MGIGKGFPLQAVVQLLDELLALIGEGNLCQTTFIKDADGRAVLHGLCDVVDVHVVAEYGGSVDVVALNGSSRESEVRRIGEGVSEVLGKTEFDVGSYDFAVFVFGFNRFGFEAVLGAVGFVGHNDNVATLGEGVVDVAFLGRELLDGGEHHTT